ncbi:hypothetical protein [Marinomonas transparens]|uniref:Transposase n=1 Tax=Marinomonas transparens TaxID=2795388 RepID=A0A934N2Y4_9GAMM|nr:hypothetical protein [Marinomonas transparens]MBJ7539167.1 hypothetical protein [Marinomonas transparens]
MVLDQSYNISEDCHSVGIAETVFLHWITQLKQERQGDISFDSKALTPEQ